MKAASSDKLDVIFLAATKWCIYTWIQMKLFICLYVLLMCMYVHFLEMKKINQSITSAFYVELQSQYIHCWPREHSTTWT